MTDTTLDRMSLQNLEKKTNETFREYAHKWRDLAAQVQPLLTDKEFNKDFLDVVLAEEMIETGVKQGKIEASEAKKQIPKRKEGETHIVTYQGKPTIFLTHHNKTMVISLITSMMGMLRKGITSQILGMWQDSLRYLHQYR